MPTKKTSKPQTVKKSLTVENKNKPIPYLVFEKLGLKTLNKSMLISYISQIRAEYQILDNEFLNLKCPKCSEKHIYKTSTNIPEENIVCKKCGVIILEYTENRVNQK